MAAAIEQNYDDKGIIWPKSLAPFEVAIVEVNQKSKDEIKKKCLEIYQLLKDNNIDVLWDDRDKRPGVKFADMEVTGIPFIIIIGERTIETGEIELKERLEQNINYCEIHFRDFGEGISEEHLSRLTERFYRVDKNRSRNQGGTGLGLSIVKHITNKHNGKMKIESQIDKGSTFSVALPIIN